MAGAGGPACQLVITPGGIRLLGAEVVLRDRELVGNLGVLAGLLMPQVRPATCDASTGTSAPTRLTQYYCMQSDGGAPRDLHGSDDHDNYLPDCAKDEEGSCLSAVTADSSTGTNENVCTIEDAGLNDVPGQYAVADASSMSSHAAAVDSLGCVSQLGYNSDLSGNDAYVCNTDDSQASVLSSMHTTPSLAAVVDSLGCSSQLGSDSDLSGQDVCITDDSLTPVLNTTHVTSAQAPVGDTLVCSSQLGSDSDLSGQDVCFTDDSLTPVLSTTHVTSAQAPVVDTLVCPSQLGSDSDLSGKYACTTDDGRPSVTITQVSSSQVAVVDALGGSSWSLPRSSVVDSLDCSSQLGSDSDLSENSSCITDLEKELELMEAEIVRAEREAKRLMMVSAEAVREAKAKAAQQAAFAAAFRACNSCGVAG